MELSISNRTEDLPLSAILDINDACPATTNVTNVSAMRALLAFEAILSVFGIFPNALMVIIVARTRVFHTNLRLLLAHLNAILLAYAAGFISKSMRVLITITFGDVCTLAMTTYECKLREMPVAFPNNALTYASFALCVERVYSTLLYKRYDNNKAKPWLGMALIGATWTIVITNQLINLSGSSRNKTTPVCENLLAITAISGAASVAPQMLLEISIAIIVLVVHQYNKRQLSSVFVNRSKLSLSARFQMDQNVQLNRIVTPCMTLQACCYIPVMVFLVLINHGCELQLGTKVLLVQFSYLWKLTFVCVQPIFSFYENPHLRKGLKKVYQHAMTALLTSKGQVSPAGENRSRQAAPTRASTGMNDGDVYFRNLKLQWEITAKQVSKYKVFEITVK